MPSSPVAPPTFPPVDDDPFAPPPAGSKKKAAAPAPARSAPVSDDPFAPLPAGTGSASPVTPESDDPFAPLPASPPAASRPKLASPTAAHAADQIAAGPERGADGKLIVRQWSDATGSFRVQARLVQILDGKVRLLKETGRTTTVPVERLSASDRAYVAEVMARYGSDLSQLDQVAAR